ncbi:MAG TPA: hypothetical protein VKZ51_02100 [Cyclobacteriaceae bacterium]|nr:hypothetical protein [Cyclobacteriaceae bacterium]
MFKSAIIVLIMLLPLAASAQLDMAYPDPGSNRPRYTGYWIGQVFQLSPDYNPNKDWSRIFSDGSGANRKFKGYVKYGEEFLPTNSLNFDIRFGDYIGEAQDSSFFETNGMLGFDPDSAGYDVQLQHFGVLFSSRVQIPHNQPGIYRFTVGSDDGSKLNVQGIPSPHDNWDGPKTFVYDENVFNYYIPYEGGERVNLDLFYYEKKGANRVSFHFERYLGPGEIEGSQDLCGLTPDPVAFGSRGPAAFLEGTIAYQWQYSSVNDTISSNWTNIEGATGLTYKVAQYDPQDPESWTGTRYFRRLATNFVNGQTIEYPSNVLRVNMSIIEGLNQGEYGHNAWIGHIYKGKGNFTDNAYLGRIYEDSIFYQNFDYNGLPSTPNYFTPDEGCAFLTERFSVRYKMKLDVSPGSYNFLVRADDGVRLSLDGGLTWAVNDWKNGSMEGYFSAPLEVSETGQLDLVLEYYEDTQGNQIDFRYEFEPLVLPLLWGAVKAWPCKQFNCLSWETIQENNTSHFELERSYDGVSWELFGPQIAAQGNSTRKVSYYTEDNNFSNQLAYYRIKQLDLDGKFAYSDIMRVRNNDLTQSFLPYPNPTVDKIRFISGTAVERVDLIGNQYSMIGELEVGRVNDNTYELDLAALRRGNYIMIVHKKQGERSVFKIIKK